MKRPTLASAAGFVLGGIALAVPFLAFADDTFVPLTQLPGLSTISASAISLPSFINNLYKISIGLAAFFAFTQIVQAGYMFMTSADSISKNTQARAKIMNAVFGLIIVLSPFVIFSIINPKILDISLDFKSLQSLNGTDSAPKVNPNTATPENAAKTGGVYGMSSCSPACTGTDVCSNSRCISATQNNAQCHYSVIELDPTTSLCRVGGKLPDSCCNANPEIGQKIGYQCCGK